VSRRRLSASLSFGFRNPPVTVLSKTAILMQVQQIVASPSPGKPDPRISVALS
jgi:hypothetical protein